MSEPQKDISRGAGIKAVVTYLDNAMLTHGDLPEVAKDAVESVVHNRYFGAARSHLLYLYWGRRVTPSLRG